MSGSAVSMDHSLKPILPLETLRGFEAAARTGSFSAAAEHLNITHGAISRQIAKLEGWLGLKLFERGARGVSLTPEGQRLFLRTSEAFALISDTTDRWSEPRGAAVVRLTSIPSVSGLWLMPRLHALEDGPTRLRIVLDGRQPSGRSGRRGARPVDPLRPRQDSRPDLSAAVRGALLSGSLAGGGRRNRHGQAGAAAEISADPRFRCVRLARLVRRARHGLPSARPGPALRGLQPRA